MGIFTKAFGGVESDERNNTLGVKVEKLLDQEKYPWSIPEESVNGGEPTHRRIDAPSLRAGGLRHGTGVVGEWLCSRQGETLGHY